MPKHLKNMQHKFTQNLVNFTGNFTTEAQIMRDRFEERTNKVIEVVRGAMSKASRELWNCDPKKHEKSMKIYHANFSRSVFNKNIIFFFDRPNVYRSHTTSAGFCSERSWFKPRRNVQGELRRIRLHQESRLLQELVLSRTETVQREDSQLSILRFRYVDLSGGK